MTTVKFSAPGTYVLYATANDTKLSAKTQLTIVVTANSTANQN